jgi:LuxR family maltose regulon positive regulatory protein
MRGEAPLASAMTGHVLEEFRRLSSLAPLTDGGQPAGSAPDALTGREQTVLRLAAGGNSDKQIAAELSLSLYTVKSHMRNILAKLGAANRREAAREAKIKGYLP